MTVRLDIVESQLGARLSDRLDSSTKCDLLSDILDSIPRSDLSLLSKLLDKLGDTVRDVEFVWVWVRVLGLSERFDRLVPVFVECLQVSFPSGRPAIRRAKRHTVASSSSSAAAPEAAAFFCWGGAAAALAAF